jgi:Domain of unknown function (DUF5597)/Beta-galactosidase
MRLLVIFAIASVLGAQEPAAAPKAAPLPRLETRGTVTQMIVDSRPFLMLSGELHNSSASSVEYMKPIWEKLAALHLNTVIGTASWELVEPREGKFDFTLVDSQIAEARRRNMRLVLIWFATWKNADSTYVPLWVKADLKRFPRMQSKSGANLEELTPFGEHTLAADSRAFRALMRHIKQVDPRHTVIMMQVENESGVLGDSRDRSALAEAAWSRPVPQDLMDYLTKHRDSLLPELQKVWGANGYRASGTWPEVFGTDAWAGEVFMAWHVGRYIGKVAEAGKAELNLPMYANAWLVQNDRQLPGDYPSGGPVSRVMDIWRAASAPGIDLLAPDIYIQDFQGVCVSYTRSGNPLFIPEARVSAANLVWAIGQHAALGVSPFGIEDAKEDDPLASAYRMLEGMMPLVTRAQAEGRIAGVLLDGETPESLTLGGYKLTVTAARQRRPQQAGPAPAFDNRPYGIVISEGPDSFLLAGAGFSVAFSPDSPGPAVGAVGSIDEGRFEAGRWIPGRRLNGDEFHPSLPPGKATVLRVRLYRHD